MIFVSKLKKILTINKKVTNLFHMAEIKPTEICLSLAKVFKTLNTHERLIKTFKCL